MKSCLLLLCILALAGCSSSPAPTDPNAPAGMVHIGDSGKGSPVGSTVYNNNGGVLGVVVALDGSHRFEDGTTDAGVQVKRPESSEPVWYPVNSINNFWAKK